MQKAVKKIWAEIKEFFRDKGCQKKCDCGKYDGYCPNALYITGAGVVSVNSNDLAKCGKWQKQIEQLKRIRTERKHPFRK